MLSFKKRFGTRYIFAIAALSLPRAFIADVFGDTHSLFEVLEEGKALVYEGT